MQIPPCPLVCAKGTRNVRRLLINTPPQIETPWTLQYGPCLIKIHEDSLKVVWSFGVSLHGEKEKARPHRSMRIPSIVWAFRILVG